MDADKLQAPGNGADPESSGRKVVKVGLGIPKDGDTDPAAYDSRLEMCIRMGALSVASYCGLRRFSNSVFDYPEGEWFQFYPLSIGDLFVALAREKIAEEAQRMGLDYLFMIDDDMTGPADLFERLYRHKKDIVAPLAFSRFPPHKPVVYRIKHGYDPIEAKDYFINYSCYDYPKDTLFHCDAVGFGAVLIDMKVFESLPKPWFMVMTGMGEDIYFCHRAGKAGFRTFCDTATKLGHMGVRNEITEETFLSTANQEMLLAVHGGDRVGAK